jgi:septum formation protein
MRVQYNDIDEKPLLPLASAYFAPLWWNLSLFPRAGVMKAKESMAAAKSQTAEPKLLLASSSPRRRALLQALELRFTVAAADVDETPQPGEMPDDLALRLAIAKAQVVAARVPASEGYLVIAADTVVALGEQIMGKPVDEADAWRMLALLRAGPHQVYSAVTLLDTSNRTHRTRLNTTTVLMRAYTDEEIDAYIATGDPLDKAGAYGLQHVEFAPAMNVEGCPASVIGLPLGDLRDLLVEAGVQVRPVAPVCERHIAFACCRRAGEGYP